MNEFHFDDLLFSFYSSDLHRETKTVYLKSTLNSLSQSNFFFFFFTSNTDIFVHVAQIRTDFVTFLLANETLTQQLINSSFHSLSNFYQF